ncbi:TPA: RTX toxin, partial [Yersinia enterocolitica]|nr:RTX toxin [Yersinia enterocolitica]
DGSKCFTFFDPNFGEISYDNISDFKHGVKNLLNQEVNVGRSKKILGEVYGISQGNLKELDVYFNINEFENDVIRIKEQSIFKQAQDGEQAYIVKSLKENNIIFDLPLKSTAKVIDYSLVQKSTGEWLVKNLIVEVTAEGKVFNVHQSVESFDIAVKNLRSNIDILINYKNDNPSIMDLDLAKGVITKSIVSFVPDVVKEKTYSEIAVYKPELESLSSRTKRVIDILDRLAEKRISLAELSSNSKKSLAEFFNLSHDVLNSRDILKVIADSDFYLQTRLELSELQQASANNSQFEKLTGKEALVISKQLHTDKTDKYLKSINLTGRLGTKPALMVNQFLTLSTDSASGLKKQLDLGAAYLYASSKGDLPQFKQQLSKHLELCYLKAQGIISDNEKKQLDNFNDKFNALSELQYKDVRHLLTDGNLSNIPALEVGYYQLMIDDTLLNISVEKTGDNYSCSIYDTEGGESIFHGIDKSAVSKKALSFIESYIVTNAKTSIQNYKLYSWDFSDGAIDGSGLQLKRLYQQNLITERQRLAELGNTFFNQQKIAFSTLSDMGAVLDGKLLTADAVANNPDWQTKLRFDPFLINEFYTLPDQTSAEQQQSVKVIKSLLNSKDSNNNLLNDHPDPNVIQDARRYLAAINLSADLNSNTNPKLWDRLIQASAQSSRFQSFGQKVGTATQAIGVLTLSISTYGMAKRLRDPNITDEERKEITKQLAINWSSISVDFGTDLMQPTFDKLHRYFSKKLLSSSPAGVGRIGYKMAAKTAKYAGAGLNLASAGFDIHEAIEHISNAVSEKNPDLRTDSIVNGSLAVIGAAVSIATAIALAIGASAAGPIGIIVGAGIMLGGMIYNAVRQVEYIKREIELTGWQEFKTGFRLAFGAEPEKEILNKLSAEQKRKMDNFRLELVKNTYTKIIQPMGFNTLLYVNEEIDLTPVKKYIFIYKLDSGYKHSTEEWLRKHTNDSVLGYLSDKEVSDSISKDLSKSDMERYYIMRYKRKPLSANDYQKWRETVNVEDFDIVEINESDLDNRHSQDNLIIKNDELFKTHSYLNGLSDSWLVNNEVTTTIEISKNIDGNINTNFNFYEYSTTESIRTNQYGNNPDKSTHFNPGRGNDIIVGYKEHRNSFDVGEGEKIFIGGDKEDTFYLMGDVRASSHSRTTVLDGQGGSDTLILLGLRFGKGYDVDLERGMAKYIDDELSVASVSNIENVYGHDGFYNEIKGDMNDNFLKVGDGEAYLEGRAGNDILALNRGVAIGGFGVDTYVISSNEITPINVTIIDTGRDELSSILLPVNVVDIRSILLSGNDVIISVDEKKHSDGKILLKDVYYTNDDKNLLSHGYIINTMDGFVLLPNWPMELNKNTAASSLEMTAIYNYLADKTLCKKDGIPIKPLNLTSHKEEVDRDYMRIDDRVVFFPEFIKCSSEANGIIPHQMFGTKENEIFSNFGMGDLVAGNGGNDVINIPNLATSTKSYENNMDIYCSPLVRLIDDNKENTITLVFDNVSCYDLEIKNSDDKSQVEIYHKNSKENHFSVNLYSLSNLTSASGKKLITLIDKNKAIFYIEDKGIGHKIIEALPTKINVTEDNDNIFIPVDYRLENEILEMGKGNDTVSDLSGRGHTLNGNQGDDVIWAKSGNNRLNGGHGNDQLFSGDGDDRLYGGLGNDTLCNGIDYMSGGEDNDIYIIEKGQGETTINDDHGKNTIIFDGTYYRELWFKKRENKLLITIEGTEKKVVISNYVSGKGASSEFSFQTNSHKIEGDNLNLLIDYMTRTPEIRRENIQDPGHGMYGMDFNRAWSLIVA